MASEVETRAVEPAVHLMGLGRHLQGQKRVPMDVRAPGASVADHSTPEWQDFHPEAFSHQPRGHRWAPA